MRCCAEEKTKEPVPGTARTEEADATVATYMETVEPKATPKTKISKTSLPFSYHRHHIFVPGLL